MSEVDTNEDRHPVDGALIELAHDDALGLLFQVPLAILAVTRAGLITPQQLRRNRRYAVAACALVAAALPGDAITMLLETLPLYLLFECSVLFVGFSERRARRLANQESAA